MAANVGGIRGEKAMSVMRPAKTKTQHGNNFKHNDSGRHTSNLCNLETACEEARSVQQRGRCLVNTAV
jgi:hypothetical protein